MTQSKFVHGVVMQGHQIASGMAKDSPYPGGSVSLQMPFFKALGLDLTGYFPGTLNISVAPAQFRMLNPAYCFEKVAWIAGFNAETFSFAECTVWFSGKAYQGFVYYPHPETKTQHFHDASLLEVICQPIKGVHYGNKVRLEYLPEQISLS
ncbi:hypothetical protein [Planctobacterium marinum]|uniref:hypothetical protein n=1 Tax=Planctobacterium marinum TaxID=1631968 RepID=UPI001E5450FE|nr:hypothetical protein [Planctobacterium marinum]MCC2605431.1 hypothetical protein [Planctobacterium marinum]